MFLSEAMAAAPGTAPGTAPVAAQADGTVSLVMIVVIFVLFYFMLIRPQNKRAREHRNLISQLKVGDEIIISGGFLAKIISIDEQYARVSLSDNLPAIIQRSAVQQVLPKGTIKSLSTGE